jgi:hypothetical protein
MTFGFRFGDRGTHISRTLMLDELERVLASTPQGCGRAEYAEAIVNENVTEKRTTATRRLTNQRLGELYALDPCVPLFRVLRRFWASDKPGRPLIALLCALARDPLLRVTAPPVLSLRAGDELSRQSMTEAVLGAVGGRLNDSIIDKVVRNASSSWTQSGHFKGRVRKIRQCVSWRSGCLPRPASNWSRCSSRFPPRSLRSTTVSAGCISSGRARRRTP